ncbi:hypothetical protein VHUM_01780 [Vanrija humicola]|uniref:Calcineurin-like phosphoesterase domain-containing protein n=1 Tax=Vanrija humicola TaxID=5417 RepID=A0A7D8V1Q9_VANHU|nr:hypothetical protein VHUM_01780 [Vanrija humicola]
MPTRLFLVLAAAAAALLLLFWRPGAPPASEAPPSSSPGGEAFRQRLVAIGDLHGDIDNAKRVLRMARLTDKTDRWAGGNDIFVQTGDCVDRGTFAREIYELWYRLRSEAHAAGGRVINLLGNHEVMNAIGDWRYVTQADIKHWGGVDNRQHELSTDGWLGKDWLANYSISALVPLSPFPSAPTLSFQHGSLRPSFPNLTPYPDAINRLGHSLLTRALTPPLAKPYPPNPYSGLPAGTTREEAELYDGGGPLWWRGLADVEDDRIVCGWAKELQEKIGVRRVIGGHTPDFDKIVHRCNASVIIIDTGISYAYGGVLSALEIIYTLTPPFAPPANGTDEPHVLRAGEKYIEREEVNAIYPTGKKRIALEVRQIVL